MFTTGLPLMSLSLLLGGELGIAIPMGIQVFAWIATLWDGKPVLRAPMLFILGFLFIFMLGGLTGVMVAAVPYDWQVHDTYFVVAHFHYVLIGGMVFPIFAALYYWTPLVTGRMLSRAARALGLLAHVHRLQRRLPADARHRPARHAAAHLHLLRRSRLELAEPRHHGLLLRLRRRRADLRRRLLPPSARRASGRAQPLGAPSLEWLSAGIALRLSQLMPIIDSRYPLWDRQGSGARTSSRPRLSARRADRRARVARHRADHRRAGADHPRCPARAGPPSSLPCSTAVGLHGGDPGFTTSRSVFGVVAAAAYLYWLWSLDAPYAARAGRRRPRPRPAALPQRQLERRLVGDGGAAGLGRLGHRRLRLRLSLPLDGAALACGRRTDRRCRAFSSPRSSPPRWSRPTCSFETAERINRQDRRLATAGSLVGAAAFAVAAAVAGWAWLSGLGIDPTRHSYGAAVWTILGYMGLHVVVGAGMALWCLARLGLGMIDSWRCLTLRICLLWWHLTAPATVLALLLVAGFPHVVS